MNKLNHLPFVCISNSCPVSATYCLSVHPLPYIYFTANKCI